MLFCLAYDVRKSESEGDLLEKKLQIQEELGERFTWDFVIDVAGKKRKI